MNEVLSERYASPKLNRLLSKESRYRGWRTVWIVLAEAQHELGFPINKLDLDAAKRTAHIIDFDRVKEIESQTRHDVMAHLQHWAEITPEAASCIHLGATSCYVTDNAENVINREALHIIVGSTKELLRELAPVALKTASHAVRGYTHFQVASPTTVGKRIAMWMQDITDDVIQLEEFLQNMVCRGAKGTTGTQASYLALADGDHFKVAKLDELIAEKLEFKSTIGLSGQTITRKQDAKIADLLSQLAISLSKMGNDVRLLSHTGDLREGFSKGQVGSSAMPYKRNPMMAERLCALTRLVPQYRNMLAQVAMTQWLERSLDDSATRRVAIPDMFLAIDGALNTAKKLAKLLTPGPEVEHWEDSVMLGFEQILAQVMANGHKEGRRVDRQEIHEKLKLYAHQADDFDVLLQLLNDDPTFEDCVLCPLPNKLIGAAHHQTVKFLRNNQQHWSKRSGS